MLKEYKYVLEKKDLKNFARENMFMKNAVIQNVKSVSVLSLIISFCVLLLGLNHHAPVFNLILDFIVLFCVIFVGTFLLVYLILFFVAKIIKTSEDNNITLQLDTEAESFSINTRTLSTTYKWSGISEIYNKKHNILLYTTQSAAFIVPKRIFATEEELNEFWNIISDCYNKAKEK